MYDRMHLAWSMVEAKHEIEKGQLERRLKLIPFHHARKELTKEIEILEAQWASTVRMHDIEVKVAKARLLETELESHSMVVELIKARLNTDPDAREALLLAKEKSDVLILTLIGGTSFSRREE